MASMCVPAELYTVMTVIEYNFQMLTLELAHINTVKSDLIGSFPSICLVSSGCWARSSARLNLINQKVPIKPTILGVALSPKIPQCIFHRQ